MAITDKEQGVWILDEVYNKQNEGTIWDYSSSANSFWSWGYNGTYGVLGQNNTTIEDYSSPTQVGSGTDWSSLGGGYHSSYHAAAVKTDGTLWIWGRNYAGSLGLNQTSNTNNRSSPTQLPGTTWDYVSVRAYSTMGHRTDGTLWSWGRNTNGSLGQNSETQRSSPTQVGGDTWSTLFSYDGGWGSIKTDGTLWMWGDNESRGWLAQNNNVQYSSPVQVGTDTTWSKTSAVNGQAIGAIKTDGSLWTWGANQYGLCAQNTPENTQYSSPIQVGTDTNWSKVDTTYNCSAIKTDGTLWVWGNNEEGQLMQNNETQYSSPVQVGSGTDWYDSCGGGNSGFMASKTDGTLWVCGENKKGRLGLNQPEATIISSPVQVPGFGSGGVLSLSTAETNSIAVLENL